MTINANLVRSYDVGARQLVREMVYSMKGSIKIENTTPNGFDLVIGSSVSNKTFTLGMKMRGNTVSGQLSTGNIKIIAEQGWIMEGHMEIDVSGTLVDDEHPPPPVAAEVPSAFSISNSTHLFAVDKGTAAQLTIGGFIVTLLAWAARGVACFALT